MVSGSPGGSESPGLEIRILTIPKLLHISSATHVVLDSTGYGSVCGIIIGLSNQTGFMVEWKSVEGGFDGLKNKVRCLEVGHNFRAKVICSRNDNRVTSTRFFSFLLGEVVECLEWETIVSMGFPTYSFHAKLLIYHQWLQVE